MKEIGGYIEFEHYYGKEFHSNAIKLNCGRNCLSYLIKIHNIKHIYIPYFLCDSVLSVCKKFSVKVSFYHISEDFLPILPAADFANDWLYVVNYYGQITNRRIVKLSHNVKNLIVDNVQAFFQKPVPHVATIYSCRKFFGVSDGAYLYSDKKLEEELEFDNSYNRMEFLLGRFEKSASDFYSQYSENNKLFKDESLKRMSLLTNNLMRSFNYKCIRKIRSDNFRFMHKNLNMINKLKLTNVIGAFAYPLYLENGENIRNELQKKKIYIPILWPDIFSTCAESDLEYIYAKNILPLPIDQRYSKGDLYYLIKVILQLEKK